MKLEAVINQVVVKLLSTEKTDSGIVLAKSDQEVKTGEIISVAKNYYDNGTPISPGFNVGDKIHFVTYSSPFVDGTDKIYYLTWQDVKAKIIN